MRARKISQPNTLAKLWPLGSNLLRIPDPKGSAGYGLGGGERSRRPSAATRTFLCRRDPAGVRPSLLFRSAPPAGSGEWGLLHPWEGRGALKLPFPRAGGWGRSPGFRRAAMRQAFVLGLTACGGYSGFPPLDARPWAHQGGCLIRARTYLPGLPRWCGRLSPRGPTPWGFDALPLNALKWLPRTRGPAVPPLCGCCARTPAKRGRTGIPTTRSRRARWRPTSPCPLPPTTFQARGTTASRVWRRVRRTSLPARGPLTRMQGSFTPAPTRLSYPARPGLSPGSQGLQRRYAP